MLSSCHLHAVFRAQVFAALIRQPVSFFDVEEVGALTSRLGSDCQAVVRALATNFNVAVRNLMQCIGKRTPCNITITISLLKYAFIRS